MLSKSWEFHKDVCVKCFLTWDINLMWLVLFLHYIYQISLMFSTNTFGFNYVFFKIWVSLLNCGFLQSIITIYFSQKFSSNTAHYFIKFSSCIHLSKQRYLKIKKTLFSFKSINIEWCSQQCDRGFRYVPSPPDTYQRHVKNNWNL